MIKKKYFYWTVAIILLFSSGYIAWAAVSGETLINVQNPDYSVTAGSRVKDAGSITDNQTTGILPSGLMIHDGTNWDKAKGDTTNGVWVNVKNGFVNVTTNVSVVQSGTWFANITGINGSIRARQSGTWFSNITGINGSVRARQSGNWTVIPNSSSFSTIFNSNTSGFGSFKNLSGFYSKHFWQIKSTKSTPDVTWTIQFHQSGDGVDSESADTFTTVTNFSIRNIANKPMTYVRAQVVQRTYTGTRPTITIKTKSGGN